MAQWQLDEDLEGTATALARQEAASQQPRRRRRSTRLYPIGKRALDVSIASLLIVLTLPIWVAHGLFLMVGRTHLHNDTRVGLAGRPFTQYVFCARSGRETSAGRLPVLLSILVGQMSLVGPRPVAPGDPLASGRSGMLRQTVRPGLVCLHWLRERANIAYADEAAADAEYLRSRGFWTDLGILLRAVPAALFGSVVSTAPAQVSLLGIPLHNLTMNEAIGEIVSQLDAPTAAQICFVNADCVNIAQRNARYRDVLQRARLTLADGIGLKLAGKILGWGVRQNVNGTDLFPRLCRALEGTGKRVYLLGGRPGVAQAVVQWMASHYPDVQVCGWRCGYFTAEEEPQIVREIADARTDLLLVAFGAPRQDCWIAEHLEATGARVAIGVGGLFDFYSGRLPRAPLWMREIGLEWLYRFLQEPRRLAKRYFVGNAVFLLRVLGEKFRRGAPAQITEAERAC